MPHKSNRFTLAPALAALVAAAAPAFGVTLTPMPIPAGARGVQFPAWSPDGTRMAASTWAIVGRDSTLTLNVFVMDTATQELVPVRGLRALPAGPGVPFVFMPRWAPDGTRLIVVSDFRPWVVSVGDSAARLVNFETARNPDWSPDGTRIAYDGVRVAPSGGGLGTSFTQGADRNPAWSPDGLWMAFDRFDLSGRHLWVAPGDAPRGPARQITRGDGEEFSPAWSPDGRFLAFVANRGGQRDLWVASVDTGLESRVTDDAGIEATPDWSPDGTRLAFTSDRDGRERIWIASDIGAVAVQPTSISDWKRRFR